MRVLFDECLPQRLKNEIVGHEVVTVPEAGWAGRSNGELLALARGHYDVFVMIDQNLPAQQGGRHPDVAVIVLVARSNRFEDLRPLVPELLAAFSSIKAGDVVRLGS